MEPEAMPDCCASGVCAHADTKIRSGTAILECTLLPPRENARDGSRVREARSRRKRLENQLESEVMTAAFAEFVALQKLFFHSRSAARTLTGSFSSFLA